MWMRHSTLYRPSYHAADSRNSPELLNESKGYS